MSPRGKLVLWGWVFFLLGGMLAFVLVVTEYWIWMTFCRCRPRVWLAIVQVLCLHPGFTWGLKYVWRRSKHHQALQQHHQLEQERLQELREASGRFRRNFNRWLQRAREEGLWEMLDPALVQEINMRLREPLNKVTPELQMLYHRLQAEVQRTRELKQQRASVTTSLPVIPQVQRKSPQQKHAERLQAAIHATPPGKRYGLDELLQAVKDAEKPRELRKAVHALELALEACKPMKRKRL